MAFKVQISFEVPFNLIVILDIIILGMIYFLTVDDKFA